MSDDESISDSSMASDYGLLKKALPFDCIIPDDFDPNKVPQTAEEFLQYASYERSLMKPWISVNIDPSKLKNANCKEFEAEDLPNSVASQFRPSNDWQEAKLKDFEEFRNFVQSKVKGTSTDIFIETNFKEHLITHSPDFSTMIKYSQADKIKLLELIIGYLNSLDSGSTINFNVGTWIYATLALIELPLFPDDCHIVRLLAKNCIVMRTEYTGSDKEKFDTFNLFICLVSRFFRQLDLCDR